MFEKESAQNFSKANPPCKEHGVPAAPAKQNPGCPKPVPSLGWKAHHTPFPRSWGWGRNASSGTLPAGNVSDSTLQHPLPRAPWTGPSRGAERWGAPSVQGPAVAKMPYKVPGQ